jgi:hypothetical protein
MCEVSILSNTCRELQYYTTSVQRQTQYGTWNDITLSRNVKIKVCKTVCIPAE